MKTIAIALLAGVLAAAAPPPAPAAGSGAGTGPVVPGPTNPRAGHWRGELMLTTSYWDESTYPPVSQTHGTLQAVTGPTQSDCTAALNNTRVALINSGNYTSVTVFTNCHYVN